MVFAALQSAKGLKHRVPDDVAVIEFDDQPMVSEYAIDLKLWAMVRQRLLDLQPSKSCRPLNTMQLRQAFFNRSW